MSWRAASAERSIVMTGNSALHQGQTRTMVAPVPVVRSSGVADMARPHSSQWTSARSGRGVMRGLAP